MRWKHGAASKRVDVAWVSSRHHALLLLLLLLLPPWVCFTRLAPATFGSSIVHDHWQRRHCLTFDLVISASTSPDTTDRPASARPGADRLIDGCRPNGRRAAGNLHLDRLLYARLTPSKRATAIDRSSSTVSSSSSSSSRRSIWDLQRLSTHLYPAVTQAYSDDIKSECAG